MMLKTFPRLWGMGINIFTKLLGYVYGKRKKGHLIRFWVTYGNNSYHDNPKTPLLKGNPKSAYDSLVVGLGGSGC